ncbi:DUF1772 domain-containing protein [Nocardia otitidiscaviarum]|uniref:DUF1772 domain-containing protein n=1 Tax=Nocardia otitidiscaviarum TaxID=1823 RepID=UPI0006943349|nr:DUF1772 domain-containing protein [Nocardia otitidiscaviarum]MBF6136298.1 DUF1772 domain-containing protein [Nocardia otitidiscaviarum]MBF6241493.1 DUF1772 domain-containing protein [Nocardia otitidiscaviarum]MBF6484500.1 DUF1772 domain-containing protein [Nocardia otitidiscaviarum]
MTFKRTIWLWLLVIFVSIQFGGGLYEKLAVIPLWAEAPPEQVLATMQTSGFHKAGRAFWPFVSPVVALLSLICLFVARRAATPLRNWWLAGAAIMTLSSISTYAYFATQMLVFQNGGDDWDADRVESFVGLWTTLNYPRMVLAAVGWLCLLRALSLSGVAGAGDRRPLSATAA